MLNGKNNSPKNAKNWFCITTYFHIAHKVDEANEFAVKCFSCMLIAFVRDWYLYDNWIIYIQSNVYYSVHFTDRNPNHDYLILWYYVWSLTVNESINVFLKRIMLNSH